MTQEELQEIIFTSIGTASMCWTQTPKGIFKSEDAKALGDKLIESINQHVREVIGEGNEEVVGYTGKSLDPLQMAIKKEQRKRAGL